MHSPMAPLDVSYPIYRLDAHRRLLHSLLTRLFRFSFLCFLTDTEQPPNGHQASRQQTTRCWSFVRRIFVLVISLPSP